MWKTFKDSWLSFINSEAYVYAIFFILFCSLSAFIFLHAEKLWGVFPTFFIAYIALFFSYHGYKFSKEKFRLDLFDKRFEIYNDVLSFCSIANDYGNLRKQPLDTEMDKETKSQAVKLAHKNFRGIGWHKCQILFDKDIYDLMKELDKNYIILMRTQPPIGSSKYEKFIDDEDKSTEFIWNTIKKLPDYFKSYLYFGNYKN